MDELSENLVVLLVPVALGLYSLGVVHLTLWARGWNGRTNTFAASWRSTLALWVVSAAVTIIFNNNDRMFGRISGTAVYVILLFVANMGTIAGVLATVRGRGNDKLTLLKSEFEPTVGGPILSTAAIVTLVAIVSYAGLLVAVGDIQNRYFPKPPVQFGIYDL